MRKSAITALVAPIFMLTACSPEQQAVKTDDKDKAAAGTASNKAFKAANDKMHKDMGIALTADVDTLGSELPA
jgi:protein involved in sex pheromone biosynthesis